MIPQGYPLWLLQGRVWFLVIGWTDQKKPVAVIANRDPVHGVCGQSPVTILGTVDEWSTVPPGDPQDHP